MKIEQLFIQTITAGLQRKTFAHSVSSWAEHHVVLGNPIPGPMTFKYHPWSREWCDCVQDWIGKKSAQMAMTHSALLRAMFTNDILAQDVLYVLPKRSPDAADFSKAKFDAILEHSPHLQTLYSNVRNVGHKQAGSANFFLRGARSRSGLKSLSVAKKIFDEYDEMPQENVTLAEERSSGYLPEDVQTIKISTPTLPDFGIDKEFNYTTKENYIFTCPRCSRLVQFIFPNCLVITADSLHDIKGIANSHLICPECKGKILHEEKFDIYKTAKWVPTGKSDVRGFYINQFYSHTVTPQILAKKRLKANESNEPADEQEWWNSSGGLPHLVEGARIPEELVFNLRKSYSNHDAAPQGLKTIGIDMGRWMHVEICQWFFPNGIGASLNNSAVCKVLHVREEANILMLDQLMREYQPFMGVIDADPDHRAALEFAKKFHGHIFLWYPSRFQKEKELTINEDHLSVKANRTSWLDLSQGRFRQGTIQLPQDLPDKYPKHISSLIRRPIRGKDGEPTAQYINTGPDHYAFAHLFNEIALPIAVSVSQNRDIGGLL